MTSQVCVVAQGHQDLLRKTAIILADCRWIQVIENRRRDQCVLPRHSPRGR